MNLHFFTAPFLFIHRYEREPNAEIRKGTEPAGSVSRSENGCKTTCSYSFHDIQYIVEGIILWKSNFTKIRLGVFRS